MSLWFDKNTIDKLPHYASHFVSITGIKVLL